MFKTSHEQRPSVGDWVADTKFRSKPPTCNTVMQTRATAIARERTAAGTNTRTTDFEGSRLVGFRDVYRGPRDMQKKVRGSGAAGIDASN